MKKIINFSKNNMEIILFILLVYILGFALQMPYVLNTKNTFYLLFTMWVPAVSVLLLGMKSIKYVLPYLKNFGLKYIFLGGILILLPHAAEQIILFLTNLGSWNSEIFILSNAQNQTLIEIKKASLVLGSAKQSIHYFVLNMSLTVLLASVITTIIGGLGEEIGWRSFLQRKLNSKYHPVLGTLLVGIIWSLWHTPANLAGLNGKEHVLLGSLVFFPVSVISMSFLFSWLLIKSKSVWPCAFVHGINNTITNLSFIKANSEMSDLVVGTVVFVLFGFVFLYLIYRDYQVEINKVTKFEQEVVCE